MINKRLFSYLKRKKYVYAQVLCQWIALLTQIVVIFLLGSLMESLWKNQSISHQEILETIIIVGLAVIIKCAMRSLASLCSYHSTSRIKLTLREEIYRKLLNYPIRYTDYISASQIVQLSAEGVDQLEMYFGRYLPQLFFSLLVPITLFLILWQGEWKTSL